MSRLILAVGIKPEVAMERLGDYYGTVRINKVCNLLDDQEALAWVRKRYAEMGHRVVLLEESQLEQMVAHLYRVGFTAAIVTDRGRFLAAYEITSVGAECVRDGTYQAKSTTTQDTRPIDRSHEQAGGYFFNGIWRLYDNALIRQDGKVTQCAVLEDLDWKAMEDVAFAEVHAAWEKVQEVLAEHPPLKPKAEFVYGRAYEYRTQPGFNALKKAGLEFLDEYWLPYDDFRAGWLVDNWLPTALVYSSEDGCDPEVYLSKESVHGQPELCKYILEEFYEYIETYLDEGAKVTAIEHYYPDQYTQELKP